MPTPLMQSTPAGVLSLARGVNQRKESGCNPADNPGGSAAANRIGQGVNPNILATLATPRGRAIPGQGVNQRKESGCNPR